MKSTMRADESTYAIIIVGGGEGRGGWGADKQKKGKSGK
jgi:hypothetical protein